MSETRTLDAPGFTGDGRRLHGYAAVYNTASRDLGGFTERIAHGAFDDVLANSPDVHLLLNHNEDAVLARTTAGTLRLSSDTRGLRFEADLPDAPLGQNVRSAVGRGDLTGASFRFVVAPDGETWDGNTRTITRIAELIDVTVATRGAYPAAAVELRTHTKATKEAPQMDTDPAVAEPVADDTTPTEPEARTTTTADTSMKATTLRVEDRAATTASAPVETRVRDAIRAVNRGEARALTVASTLAPGELSAFLFDRLRARSVALASGMSVVATDKDTVTFPRLTADVTPGWYAEAATITAGDPTLDSLTATPRKLAHRTIFSNEVIDDSEPSAVDVVRDNMIAALALKLDLGIFEGTGTPPEIRGLKNVAGVNTVSMGTNGAQITSLDPILDAIKLLEDANAMAGAIVMGPRVWRTIRGLKDSTNRYQLTTDPSAGARGSLFGIPVYVSSQLSTTETQGTSGAVCASVYVYQPDQLWLVRRSDVEVELDRSRLFDTDQSELRGKMRADLLAPNPTAITRVLGILP